MMQDDFYRDKRVLVTGHTGFKGSWLCMALQNLGAKVTGYALEPPTNPSLYELSQVGKTLHSVEGDIRDLARLRSVFAAERPQIVIHMAAQPIVRESYRNPAYTYEVNVMGTVNVLECIRETSCVRSLVNVTTDKVYENREWEWGYREIDRLNGFDPYSNSKSCSELVTQSYRQSFFADGRTAISTARAGNVIGGGDFAVDRIVPDCLRAVQKGGELVLRNPGSVRPYQHVLEPLFAYLLIARRQYEDISYAGSYNIGPEESSCVTTEQLAGAFGASWEAAGGCAFRWRTQGETGMHETNLLKLDCARMKKVFGWKPVWDYRTAIDMTVAWTKTYLEGGDIPNVMSRQILAYTEGVESYE